MVIWTGFGFVIAVIVIGCVIATELITGTIAGNDSFYEANTWLLFFSFIVAAGITYALSKTIMAPKHRKLTDDETGEEVNFITNKHSLFFVPIKWWVHIFIVLGLSALVTGYEQIFLLFT